MKERIVGDAFQAGTGLYIEHMRVEHHTFLKNRQFIVMAYVAYGGGSALIGSEQLHVAQGDIFLIAPGCKAEFIIKENESANPVFEMYYILFESAFLGGAWETFSDEFVTLDSFFGGGGQNYIKVTDNTAHEIRNSIVQLIHEYYENEPGRNSALTGHLLVLIPAILRRSNVTEKIRIFSKNMLVDQTIRQIRSTIYENPKPSEIAAHRFVTREHLGRIFKQETGMTVTEYINRLRVDMIKDILKNTDRPIEDIPLLFNTNIKYLRQSFKKYTGMSMKQYRLAHRYR